MLKQTKQMKEEKQTNTTITDITPRSPQACLSQDTQLRLARVALAQLWRSRMDSTPDT